MSPSSASLNPGSATFSVTVHLKTSTVTTYDSADVIRKGLSTNSATFWKVEIRPSSAGLTAKVPCYFWGSSTRASLYATPNVVDGAWHTIQCIKQPGSIAIVFDGRLRTETATVGSISNSADLTIGAKSFDDDGYTGLVDEVSVDR